MHTPSVEQSQLPKPSLAQLAREASGAGGWIHVEDKALKLGATMNGQEWSGFLDELTKLGLTELSKVLRANWCKVGTTTVPTVSAAVRDITKTHNLRLMLGAATDVTRVYDESMRQDLIRTLEQQPLTQTVAKELRARFANTLKSKS